ncbi:Protein of unknown function [Streptomyces sp. 2224.1]|uniref:DUF4232 domain-containing protein n=1 Tax=unclassified Streptomyces TaxID=2593676 RepID=UPI000888A7D7|nr:MULTISPECIES: DUF4232 domain-containing protein [unclassified Streptomyces]PBC86715.1 uncharacterized protein DUF4232 [Streptomyces sp. 2321.6]SDQ74752.1 Protein of unknown function [Streptomyces sp. KS_16]SED48547.1 Protein of unknown function [Streptomyces sp. 2112.3]SED83712.1 Protein of unknown function [Streptomyces sp. 2224.1]SEE07195.1 Protein of unknown function [Streptomyces sp. 2133.1]
MRTTRRATQLVAATAVLTASLALTACQNDTTKNNGSQAPTASSRPLNGGQDAQSPSGGDSNGKDNGPAKSGHASKASVSSGASGSGNAGKNGSAQTAGQDNGSRVTTTACTGAHVKVTVTKVRRPVNHMLLTATNTGSVPCNAYGAPYLRWDDGQAATTFLEASKPQAVITLAPGESAYAGIMYQSADGSGSEGHTARTLGVLFGNRAGDGSTGPSVRLTLPNGGVHTDSSAWVTYWQSRSEDALTW